MHKLILVFLIGICSISEAQKVDPSYYLFGLSFDYSITTYTKVNPSKQKFDPWIHESEINRGLRLSEILDKNLKKRRPKKGCRNCHEFLKIKKIDLKIIDFYDLKIEKANGFRSKKFSGIVKNEKIENATENQMLSFLAGIYNGYGTISGDTIKFQFGHVDSKLEITRKFIDLLQGSKYLNLKTLEPGTLGGGPLLIFIPNGVLEEYLKEEIKKINTLANNG